MRFSKSIITALILGMVFSFSSIAQELDFEPYNAEIYIDGEQIELKNTPMLFENTRWLPMGEICDYLNYNVFVEDNSVTVTPKENCKNSDAKVDKITFEIGAEQIMMYSGEYENKINNIYTTRDDVYSPMTYVKNDVLYINSYYMQRAFQLKIKTYSPLESDTIKIYTRNYIISSAADSKPLIAVHLNLDISIEGIRAEFNSSPILDKSNRILVPAREFCELLNKSLDWFDEPPRVAISNAPAIPETPDSGSSGGDSIWFTIGENQYRINGNYYDMDTAACLIGGKTYVPLRILAEYLGYNVVYLPASGS